MERDNILSVWNEVRISDEGISVTLYSEDANDVYVEDELWFTHNELLDESSNRIHSLRLSRKSREIMEDGGLNQYQELENFLMSNKEEPKIEAGSIVKDENSPEWSDLNYLKVERVTSIHASRYLIEDSTDPQWATTVADVNPKYPADDYVVECHYMDTDDRVSQKRYAFPISRLTPVNPEEVPRNE
jgi:hypothetical protein